MTIEELAFKDRRTLANLNEKDLLDIIEFLQDDRKEWINQFSKAHNESIEIQKENQELKEKYLNAVADYETTMSEKNELKKQLENCYCNRTDCSGRIKDSKVYDSLVQKVEIQQKEFIKWLEDEIENSTFLKPSLEMILQKYKEIIGDN